VDKVQDRRIARLENAVEKKFAIKAPSEFRALRALTAMTDQIVALLPASSQSTNVNGRIGNEISLKHFRCDYTLVSDGPMAVRVIFFWLTVPRTWTVPTTANAPPASTGVDPSWPQLLNSFELDLAGTGVHLMNNIVAQHQFVTDSNESPIIRLSDKVHYLGAPSDQAEGQTSERCIKKLTFTKSYKSMKLSYNDVASSAAPVNRQLYMAVCQGPQVSTSETARTCVITHSSSMHYTDS
jgi:hypothetical protein